MSPVSSVCNQMQIVCIRSWPHWKTSRFVSLSLSRVRDECLYNIHGSNWLSEYLREAAVFLDKGGAVLPCVRHGAFAQRKPLAQRLGREHQVRRPEGHCPRQQTAVLFVLLHSRRSLWPFWRQQWNMPEMLLHAFHKNTKTTSFA